MVFAFTSCNNKKFDYKKHHLEHHQKHIELIINMNKLIDKSFKNTLNLLKNKASNVDILSQWRITLGLYNKLNDKSETYIDDAIENKSTSSSIKKMSKSGKAYSLIVASKTDIKIAIRDKNYDLSIKKISILNDKIKKSNEELLKATKEYQKQIEKFDF